MTAGLLPRKRMDRCSSCSGTRRAGSARDVLDGISVNMPVKASNSPMCAERCSCSITLFLGLQHLECTRGRQY